MTGSDGAADELTIDELAAKVGLTVRTLRAYTTRGLLPPPRLRGRTGLYGAEHVARLSVLRELLDAGYTLPAAEQLLNAAPTGLTGPGLDVFRALLTPWEPEPRETVDRDVLAARMGVPLTDARIARMAELGLVTALADGRLELSTPSLVRAGLQLGALGFGSDEVLDVQAALTEHAKAMAQACVQLFRGSVWQRFIDAGSPDDGWPAVREALDRALPVASQAVLVTFRQALAAAITESLVHSAAQRSAAHQTTVPVDEAG